VGVLSLPDAHRLIAESFALVNSSLSEGVATAVLEVMHLYIWRVRSIRLVLSFNTDFDFS